MTTIRVSVSIPSAFASAPQKAVRQALGRGLLEIAETVADLARANAPSGARGLLKANIRTEVQESGHEIIGAVFTTTAVPYAVFVHEGTLPHWAPIAPLKLWAKRVLGDEKAAYAVQHAIARRGTRAQPFLQQAVDTVQPRLRGILEQNLNETLRQLGGGV